jgi:superfamily II DNA/RNA helicase
VPHHASSSPAPACEQSFRQLGVPDSLEAVLASRGITTPFPIQAASLPDALAGRDVCGNAPTGSGKTLAFGLAVLARIDARPRPHRRGRRHPSALVLVPTRELAAQIEADLRPLAAAVGARVTSIYGGVRYAKQLSDLRNGVDVLVACPGRLSDLVDRRAVDLSFVEIVVLDEADRMADMGFLPPVRRLIDLTSSHRQTLLFSATLDGPVGKVIRDYQHDPARHTVEPSGAGRGRVRHHFWRVDAQERFTVTAETVAARGPAMVFCRTKRGADRLSQRLARAGLQSAAIHGDRSQGQRERALHAFRSGRLDVLVATDIAARGIHVDAVPLVVHFDPPADHTDYVHRAGRTGRAGADGIVVSLVTHEQRESTAHLQRRLGMPGTVTSPDLPSLAPIGAAAPPAAAPRSGGTGSTRVGTDRSRPAAPRPAEVTSSRPPRRRRRSAAPPARRGAGTKGGRS